MKHKIETLSVESEKVKVKTQTPLSESCRIRTNSFRRWEPATRPALACMLWNQWLTQKKTNVIVFSDLQKQIREITECSETGQKE